MNQINPRNGFYANIVYRPNFSFWGSDNNWQSLQTDIITYADIPEKSKNTLAFWAFNWITLSKTAPSYLFLPSTGWGDTYNTGRGYIQGRFRGQNMYYLETEYRFGITKMDYWAG